VAQTVQQVNQSAGDASSGLPHLSIHLANFAERPTGWQELIDLARTADAVGVDRLAVSDHIAFGENLDAYADPSSGGTTGGKQPTGPDGHWLEPLALLSLLAGVTSRIRLQTGILLAALRTPAVLAKQAATIDVLSGGRLDLGVGVGWQREEYEACGLDFSMRGRRLDHTLAVCRALWTEQVVDFTDDDLRFERIHAMPKPVQAGGVPIWVSGRINARTVERLVRFGTGWIPWGEHVADPRPGIAAMREALDEADRDPETLQVQGVLPVKRDDDGIDLDASMAAVTPLVEAGVTDFRFHHRWGADASADHELLTQLVPSFRIAVGR
jgi:probable F420-dependent oxidoreductase